MTSKPPIELDSRRDAAGVMGAEMRRSVSVPATAAREAGAQHDAEMERRLAAPPAADWPEAAELALYLLKTFATSMDARDPRCAALIARSITDLSRLAEAEPTTLTERPPR
jgi:hypothetical protein